MMITQSQIKPLDLSFYLPLNIPTSGGSVVV